MLSDAEFYQKMRLAEANKNLYTEEYLRFTLYSSLADNPKIYFGEKLPDIFKDMVPINNTLPFP